jgi:Brp/Blh family beta-carotene 15,15'-monooxygenase
MGATDHRWLEPALRRQAIGASVVVAAFAAASAFGVRFDLGAQAAVLLTGMVLVGFPHGAFDHLVARRVLSPLLGRSWWMWFALAYLGLAFLVWSAWIAAPLMTLALFLAGSVLHFGLGDTEDGLAPVRVPRWASVLVYGSLPVLLPVALHPSAASPVLAALGGVSEAAMTGALSDTVWLAPLWLAGFAWVALAAWREGKDVALAAVTAAGFVLLPPLLAFGFYFGLVHSPRHLLRLGAWHDPHQPRRAVRWAAWTMVPAASLCAIGLAALAATAQDWSIDLLAPTFRLIAALTLPHMVVTTWLGTTDANLPPAPVAP